MKTQIMHGTRLGRCICAVLVFSAATSAQQTSIEPVKAPKFSLVRQFFAPHAPPIRLMDSGRMAALIQGGNLYLTTQDAIALALENNIDLEISRYDPLISAWQVTRAEAGGALPGVPSGASQAGSVASGQGIAGSRAAAGVSIAGSTTGNTRSTNATITQIGPVTQTLDPIFQDTSTFSHTSLPQPNVVQSIIPNLVSNTHAYNVTLQQGYLLGGSATLTYTEHYLKENAPTDVLNPSQAPSLGISVQQNLLRGFGVAVNGRTISVAKINVRESELNFKAQVVDTVSQVLDLYYGLVADYDDLRAKRSAVDVAQTLRNNVAEQIRFGALAPLDLTTADSQLQASELDLVNSQAALEQQELQLKNLLSRRGATDPLLAETRIVPIDRISIPERDELPPISDLVQEAMNNRTDLAAEKLNVESATISSLGTKNGVRPGLQVFASEVNAGLAGNPQTVILNGFIETSNPKFHGGLGTGLSQVFRRDFPTSQIGIGLQAPLRNRQAQADYGVDQLQLRQTQLTTRKDLNQVEVDVSNYVIALRQARVRYEAAAKNRELEQQLFAAEQKRYNLGASTPFNVIQQQRDLVAAQASETGALLAYSNARVALDQTLGTTLDTNHVSITEARAAKVAMPSKLPAQLPIP